MVCPRCGNEWDASKGACTRCGFVVRTTNQPGSFPNQINASLRGNQPSGGLANPARQQSNGTITMKRQSGGLATPSQPVFPIGGQPVTRTPSPNANFGFPSTPSQLNRTFPKPTFEKTSLKAIPQNPQQTALSRSDSQSHTSGSQVARGAQAQNPASSMYAANRSLAHPQQDMRRSQMPVQHQTPVRQYPLEAPNRNKPNQPGSHPAGSFDRAASGPIASLQSNAIDTHTRPLLPGVLLRGGRYRLQELQERQDWLPGIFEATWIGRDAHRAGSQVMIKEVVLPDTTSVVTQTILRTATMALVTVGKHPHIPGLWDAFSDQGRSFFVFEPVDGETLLARLRYSGRPLPEQDVIECCLQLTDVLELLSQQSPQLVHGLIRPEHIVLRRKNSQYILTNFSVVLAGGGTQYISGVERYRLSPYTAPEFIRGVVDVRTDLYSLIATAYHAVTGNPPNAVNGNIPQAQRVNPNVTSSFDAILSKGLRTVPNQRYQRPSELRQDLLAMRSVSGTLVAGNDNNPASQPRASTIVSPYAQQAQTTKPEQTSTDQVAQALPLLLNINDDLEEPVLLLPKPEDLPPMKETNYTMNAAIMLSLILVVVIVVVVISQMSA